MTNPCIRVPIVLYLSGQMTNPCIRVPIVLYLSGQMTNPCIRVPIVLYLSGQMTNPCIRVPIVLYLSGQMTNPCIRVPMMSCRSEERASWYTSGTLSEISTKHHTLSLLRKTNPLLTTQARKFWTSLISDLQVLEIFYSMIMYEYRYILKSIHYRVYFIFVFNVQCLLLRGVQLQYLFTQQIFKAQPIQCYNQLFNHWFGKFLWFYNRKVRAPNDYALTTPLLALPCRTSTLYSKNFEGKVIYKALNLSNWISVVLNSRSIEMNELSIPRSRIWLRLP
jgi:hypothetical protein